MPDRVTRVHTPAFLQRVSLGFQNREFSADRLNPRVPVGNQSDKYRVWGKNKLIVHKADWAPGTIPNAIEIRWSEDTFYAGIRKLRTLLLDTELRNADSDLDLVTNATETVTDAIALAREKRVADLYTAAATYPGANVITKSGGAEWDQAAVADEQVFTDIIALGSIIADASLVPLSQLTVAIPEPVYRLAMMRNTALLDTIKYTQTAVVTWDLLAAAFGVKNVIPLTAVSAGTGPEVEGADVITGYPTTYLWADNVWIGLVNEGANQRQPTFARGFNWRAESGNQDRQIRRYRAEDEGREGDWIECKEAIGEKVVYSSAGGVIKNTLSTI
jgi:hypothetical protein